MKYIDNNEVYTSRACRKSWGDANQKKAGTPTNWVLVYPGTKSAQWCDPIKAASMER